MIHPVSSEQRCSEDVNVEMCGIYLGFKLMCRKHLIAEAVVLDKLTLSSRDESWSSFPRVVHV